MGDVNPGGIISVDNNVYVWGNYLVWLSTEKMEIKKLLLPRFI